MLILNKTVLFLISNVDGRFHHARIQQPTRGSDREGQVGRHQDHHKAGQRGWRHHLRGDQRKLEKVSSRF